MSQLDGKGKRLTAGTGRKGQAGNGLAPGHAALRRRVARALRRARGKHSQAAFCQMLEPYMGRAADLSQWSKYEREHVDPPAYLLLAAGLAADVSLAEMFSQTAGINRMGEQVEKLASIARALQGIADTLAAIRGTNEGTGTEA